MYKYVVYAQMKDEDNILSFWVEHYIKLGFDHIYIVDDNSINPIVDIINNKDKQYLDKITVITLDFNNDDFFTNNIEGSKFYDQAIYNQYKSNRQSYILNIFCKLYITNIEWIFICDADEFLYLKNKDTIGEYIYENISKYPNMSGIMFRWLCYGTSYHSYFPKGHLFENFIYSSSKLHFEVKSISKVNDCLSFYYHFCKLKKDKLYYSSEKNNMVVRSGQLERNSILLDYTDVDAFCAHYITQDCNTFVKRRIRRKRAEYNNYRDANSIINYINSWNKVINKSMLKYINKTINEGICNLKVVDIDKYNEKYNTKCNNIYEMLIHFFDNKTEVIYTDINELRKKFNVSKYKQFNPNLNNLTDLQVNKHYILYRNGKNRIQ